MLQANPSLSWRFETHEGRFWFRLYWFVSACHRDVQHILIESADHNAIGLYDLPEEGDDSFSVGNWTIFSIFLNEIWFFFQEWRSNFQDSPMKENKISQRERMHQKGWVENHAGLMFHRSYGFGLANANRAGPASFIYLSVPLMFTFSSQSLLR